MQKWNPYLDVDLTPLQMVFATCLIFTVAGIAGWIYEELFYRINDGYFSWRGHGVGPWLPIYAFGTTILLFATARVKDCKWKVVVLCAVISGVFEFIVGWALFHFHDGLRLWDYNVEKWNWGNIGGYVCIRSVLVFAVAGPLLLFTLVPLLGKLAKKLPSWAFALITMVPFILFVIDIIVGYFVKGL